MRGGDLKMKIDYVQIHLVDLATLLINKSEDDSKTDARQACLDLVNRNRNSEFDWVREALECAEAGMSYTQDKMSKMRAAKKEKRTQNEATEVRQAEKPKEEISQPPKVTHKFVPPTLEEVRAECSSRGMQDISEAFIGFYESNGWKVGQNQMKSWKGALTTWQHREVVRKSSPPRYESESARTSRINNEFMSRKNAGESSESIAADFEKRKAAGTL